MGIARLFRVITARWVVVLIVSILASIVGLIIAYTIPVTYSSSAVVMVESRSDPVAGIMQIMPPNFLATQLDVIKSTRVSNKVIKGLRLGENPSLRTQFKESKAQGTYDEWLSRLLQKNLVTEAGRGSNVIRVSYTSTEAVFSALMANAFVNAYLDSMLEMRLEPAKRYSSFFDDRSREMRENVEKAQSRLSKFLREKGVVATDEKQDIEMSKLSELQSQVLQAQSQAIDASSRQVQNKLSADRTQEVLSNGLVNSLKSEIIRNESKLLELTSRLGDNHPQVMEVRLGLADLRKKLEIEIGRVAGAGGVVTRISKQRETELKAALDAQRTKVLRMKETKDEIAVMQRDLEATQKAYDSVLLRYNQSNLESQNQQSNISILNFAEIPNETTFQIFMKNAIKALLAAIGIGLASAFVWEFFDRRIRSAQDITNQLNVPIVGVLSGPDKRIWYRRKKLAIQGSGIFRGLSLAIGKS